ncbi:MAG: rhodanese-like domain-containing protein, partial [Candidatus Bipolaricaulis sp.]|nr:rhodanese-like domain-containing protein [Candidatus Bipolaricaulis sp.]
MPKQTLAPGELVYLNASVNTNGFRGTVTRAVSVGSNDPADPTTELQVVVAVAGSAAPVVLEIFVGDLNLVFYLAIDVRTPEERTSGHLFSAMNIPLVESRRTLQAACHGCRAR